MHKHSTVQNGQAKTESWFLLWHHHHLKLLYRRISAEISRAAAGRAWIMIEVDGQVQLSFSHRYIQFFFHFLTFFRCLHFCKVRCGSQHTTRRLTRRWNLEDSNDVSPFKWTLNVTDEDSRWGSDGVIICLPFKHESDWFFSCVKWRYWATKLAHAHTHTHAYWLYIYVFFERSTYSHTEIKGYNKRRNKDRDGESDQNQSVANYIILVPISKCVFFAFPNYLLIFFLRELFGRCYSCRTFLFSNSMAWFNVITNSVDHAEMVVSSVMADTQLVMRMMQRMHHLLMMVMHIGVMLEHHHIVMVVVRMVWMVSDDR